MVIMKKRSGGYLVELDEYLFSKVVDLVRGDSDFDDMVKYYDIMRRKVMMKNKERINV